MLMCQKYLSLLLLFFGLSNTYYINSQNKNQPNVLLIVLDDLNDYTGFLGGHPQVKTPYMDALAKEGTVFTNAHTNAPICAPSRASFLTGIYPHVSQNFWFTNWTENEVLKNSKSLAQFMGDNGYDTYATGKLMHDRVKSEWHEYGIANTFGPYAFNGKKVVPHPIMPKEYSNNKNDGLFTSLANVPDVPANSKFPGYNGWFDVANRKPFKYINENDRDLLNDEQHAKWVVEKIKALEKTASNNPFFMAVGFVRPHTPLVAPQKYFDMYPLETLKVPVIKENDTEDTYYRTTFKWTPPWAQHFEELKASYPTLDEGLRKYLQAYLACISFVDDQVGKVLKALKESRFDENTIVILTSDHGYNHGQKEFLYKNNLWEESTRVPLIVKAPDLKISQGVRINHPVSLIDVYPTIADFSNIKSSNLKNDNGKPLSGYSLKPFLENPDNPKWKGPDVALTVVRGNFKSNEVKEQSYSVRSETHRYIRYVNGKEELYDNEKDPYEWNNLASDKKYNKIKKNLQQQMNQLLNI
ncbi:sulfatase [Flavivirga abyssicola]|uniref:sulfatase n=1 Tax=Flavivirga abyssicola TaxID=3063533 RepID=UPI0026DF9BFB|nr:sulfatase [Flavivirga sp. MEBiC07777]WVK13741.1 sulfatase [Flavivirga sp. MEBiC07777]